MQSTVAGATASFTFTGTSGRWLGSRGRAMGIALVSVDGGPAKEVDLFARPTDEAHSDIVTISDLSDGPHTLTITVTGRQNTEAQGNVVVVDGFDVQPSTTVSHWQDTDPNAHFSAGWTKSAQGFPWSGSGVSNSPELPVTAQETTTTGATVTLPFRGTAISWIGYVGPDGGIATAQIDGGAPTQVDTYSSTAKYQPVVFTAAGLADANHTLTITATGQKNAASTSSRIVVDAFDVVTPGRRYEEYESSVEELKSSNEELQSMNEELQSTNEELETSKEELQSLNEELNTVNLELSERVEQLDRANSDLRNVFDSTQIATIFLDRKLVIRTFTQAWLSFSQSSAVPPPRSMLELATTTASLANTESTLKRKPATFHVSARSEYCS